VATGRPSDAVRRSSLLTLLAGVSLAALYFVLRLLDVGKIGDPTDIGGGFILLAGYVLMAVSAVLIGRDVLRHRSGRS
jgi:hypothetical protein